MPFKISKVLSKRINYMHVQQAEAEAAADVEASGKWVEGGAPKPNVQQHDAPNRSTCKFSGTVIVRVCVCVSVAVR